MEKKESYSILLYRTFDGEEKDGKEDGKWQEIAKVWEEDETIAFLDHAKRFPQEELKLLSVHEKQLVIGMTQAQQARKDEDLLYEIHTKDQKELLCSYLVDIVRFRRATVYVMLQKSAKGFRLLVYGCDKVLHRAQCFGTALNNLKKEDINQAIANGKAKLKKQEIAWIPTAVLKDVRALMETDIFREHC